MLDESMRRRLESLNRGPLPNRTGNAVLPGGTVAGAAPAMVAADIRAYVPRPVVVARRERASAAGSVELPAEVGRQAVAGLLRRGEVVTTATGEHLRICLPLGVLWPGGGPLVAARLAHLRSLLEPPEAGAPPQTAVAADFAHLIGAMPDRVLLLDLETCGLGGSALFLIGLLRQIDGEATVELLVARNYAEEQAILESLWRLVADHTVLVTFNGKSFDWPMVLDRSVRYRFRPEASPARHVDLLHHTRRRWRGQLPNCRLQTLEWHICRRRRSGDIPGHRIPAAYAEFVRTGFEREMDAVLYHNALDLVTLLDLALRLAG